MNFEKNHTLCGVLVFLKQKINLTDVLDEF